MKSKTGKYEKLLDTEQFKQDIKHRAISGGMVTSVSQSMLFLLRLVSIVVLARMLIPEHFGLIAMVTSLTVLIERFEDIGLGDAIVQKKNITHEQVSTLFWINLAICILLTFLVAISAKAVAWFYNDERLTWITIAFALTLVFSGASIQHQALIRRRMRFFQFALIKIIPVMIGLVVGISLAWAGYGYWALVWKEIVRSIMTSFLAWAVCPWRPSLPVRNCGVKPMLKFGGNVTGYNIMFYLSHNLDSILLGKFVGPVGVGLYSRAIQLTSVPASQLIEPLKYVALPGLSTLQHDPTKYRQYFERMLAVITFIYMPLVVYIGIYSHPIVHIVLGSQWMDVVPMFRLLAISMFFSPIVTLVGMIMLSRGFSRRYLVWGLFTNGFIIVAFAVGIRWGTIGIAASWPIATIINLVFSLLFAFKGSPVSVGSTINSIHKAAIASFSMGIILLGTYKWFSVFHVAWQVGLSVLFGALIYIVTWMLFPGGKRKLREFASYPLSVFKAKFDFS